MTKSRRLPAFFLLRTCKSVSGNAIIPKMEINRSCVNKGLTNQNKVIML